MRATSTRAKYHSGWARRFDPPISISRLHDRGSVGNRDAVGRSWELDAHQRLQQPSSSRCSDRTAISLCRVLCRGSPRTLDHRWPLVHERHYAFMHVLGQQRIATGRTSEDSVTRHRMIRRRRVCYVKTLASGRVPSDANQRARSLASMMNT